MPATRADVARLAGVSPSTVTYVLTGKRATSESTRNRVLHAIEELGYLPNRHASVLAAHSVRSVGVLFRMQPRSVDLDDQGYVGRSCRLTPDTATHWWRPDARWRRRWLEAGRLSSE